MNRSDRACLRGSSAGSVRNMSRRLRLRPDSGGERRRENQQKESREKTAHLPHPSTGNLMAHLTVRSQLPRTGPKYRCCAFITWSGGFDTPSESAKWLLVVSFVQRNTF